MRERTIILDGERPVSWNTMYSGWHWSKRKAEADRVHATVRSAIDPDLGIFKDKVAIVITVYFDKQPLDPCNIPAKLYIDGLLGIWLADDSPDYVRSVTTCSRVDKDNPRVEMVIGE